MKKLLVLALSAMILTCGSVSASALVSPGLNDDSQGDSGKPGDKDNVDKKPTSPSTGVSASYAIYSALAALTCGGVAVIAKKKVSE